MPDRFAPSPTGFLHLGHAYSALVGWQSAKDRGDTFLIRIEDIDVPRCRPEFEKAIFDDLKWMGLSWPEPVMRQSTRMDAYQNALQKLIDRNLIYPCSCSRKDIQDALSARQESDHDEPTSVYPGTCRSRPFSTHKNTDALRLNISKAIDDLGDATAVSQISYSEWGRDQEQICFLTPEHLIKGFGDIILARKDIGTSYHLAVVVDDAAQAISHVTRGEDMKGETPLQVLLQHLLGLPTPKYHHHRLIRDENGKRLAKRHDALALRELRNQGKTPEGIRKLLGLDG